MMLTMFKFLRQVAGLAPLLVAEAAALVIVIGAVTYPVAAQDDRGYFGFPFFNGRQQRRAPQYQYQQPQYQQPQFQQPQFQQPQNQQPQWQFWPQQAPRVRREREQPVDASKAPPPHKQDTTPTTHVTVMGDSLADWLGYGLEDAFGETPEIGVVRKVKPNRGLIMGTSKNEYDWAAAAREILAAEKTDYVVMILGLADRQPIHVRATPPRSAGPNQKPGQPNPPAQKPDTAKTEPKPEPKPEQPSSAEPTEVPPAPDDQPASTSTEPSSSTASTQEFRTEKWAEAYAKRIDEVIAALKSKGNPVFWVGLPAIRGPRATADVVYLNELFRGRAEKAGIIYVDIWDGFVDENGAYAPYGPDFEGQTRKLRSADGVHFTKAGARKLAHYVEREIRRVMQARGTPTAMPIPDEPQPAPKAGTVARPVAGPVVSLTAPVSATEALLGAGPSRAPVGDALANRVLVKGEPVPPLRGRADDFVWPRQDGLPVASVGTVEPTAAAAAQPAAPLPQSPAPAAAPLPESPAPAAAPPPPAAASEATSPLPPPAATPPPARPKHRAAPKPAQRILPPFFDRENPRPPAAINGRSAFGPYSR